MLLYVFYHSIRKAESHCSKGKYLRTRFGERLCFQERSRGLVMSQYLNRYLQAGRESSTQQYRVGLGCNRCRKARGAWLEGASNTESSRRRNHKVMSGRGEPLVVDLKYFKHWGGGEI